MTTLLSYRTTPTAHRSPAQLLSDPEVRAGLPAAVLGRPAGDAVDTYGWRRVAECLEATSHAVACAHDGTDLWTTGMLALVADSATAAALAAVPGAGRTRASGRVPARTGKMVPLERTWFRLAGLLLGPAPVDVTALAAALADHRAALEVWRRQLLAPAGLRLV